jgi:hypothetical protein
MRASSLSNSQVIALLNRYFVPVYVSNEDYAKGGSAPNEEKNERNRIWRDAARAKLSSGTVHVYILDPGGQVIDSQHVATASKVEELIGLLERSVEKLKTVPGQPVAPPTNQSVAPRAGAGGMVLHLVSRNLVRKENDFVPVQPQLGQNRSGSWGAYPVENWIVLSGDDCKKMLPSEAAVVGRSWEIDRNVAERVLTHFYPSTENNDVRKNRMDELNLRATILSIQDGKARARLTGKLKMKHPFYHKDDDNIVEASVAGILDFEPGTHSVQSLQLATERAIYGRVHFGVVVSSSSQ